MFCPPDRQVFLHDKRDREQVVGRLCDGVVRAATNRLDGCLHYGVVGDQHDGKIVATSQQAVEHIEARPVGEAHVR